MAEGINNYDGNVVIALNMVDNFGEVNEGGVVRVIHQPMSHVTNILFSRPLKRLLVPNDGTKPRLN